MYEYQGGKGGGRNWEIGVDTYTLYIYIYTIDTMYKIDNIHTLLYIRQITNKDLLFCTRNSTQYSVIT